MPVHEMDARVDAAYVASADIHTSQFKCVYVTATASTNTSQAQVAAVSSATTQVPIGVLQNAPTAAGQSAVIHKSGSNRTRLIAGTNGVTVGDLVKMDSSGQGITAAVTDTTTWMLGTALTTAAATELMEIALHIWHQA